MGFSICIRHINCRVGLPHKISMYWNKLLMYQNMNTYIHFWSFKRDHLFFLLLLFFCTSRDGIDFQSVNENDITTISPKFSNQIKCNKAILAISAKEQYTKPLEIENNLEGVEETYFRGCFKKHDMEDQLYVALVGKAHTTFICIIFLYCEENT